MKRPQILDEEWADAEVARILLKYKGVEMSLTIVNNKVVEIVQYEECDRKFLVTKVNQCETMLKSAKDNLAEYDRLAATIEHPAPVETPQVTPQPAPAENQQSNPEPAPAPQTPENGAVPPAPPVAPSETPAVHLQ